MSRFRFMELLIDRQADMAQTATNSIRQMTVMDQTVVFILLLIWRSTKQFRPRKYTRLTAMKS